MDADDMSYETFSNMQESFSLDDPQSDMRLDIDGISYEASTLYIVTCIFLLILKS